jgi:CBS domain-containing protein
MKVNEVMTKSVVSCQGNETLDDVARKMWEHDIGALPVLNSGKVVGVITDRDIAMAACLNGRSLDRLFVEDCMSGAIYTCSPDDAVSKAEQIMGEHRVRRLPVLNKQGGLVGILSINDLVRVSTDGGRGVSPKDITATLRAVTTPRRPLAPV